MVQALQALIEFIYIARRDIIDSNSLKALDEALTRFHKYREIFRESGVRPTGFNLPRQHSLIHYYKLIRAYGAPNGLCSSITESKHIKAVKEPWRRSNRFDALSQILLTNQRLDKLAASRVDFADRGMLQGTCLSYILEKLGMSSICSYCLIKLTLSPLTGINGSVYDSDNRAPAVPAVAATMMPTLRRTQITRITPLLDQRFWLVSTWQRQSVS
jgi:hypothetical protein